MPKTVFILGAGASHAAARTPLMKDFIDTAADLLENKAVAATQEFGLVFDLINSRLPRLQAKSVVDLNDIESVFSLVEMGNLLGRLPDTETAEVAMLNRAMRVVLTETIERSCLFNVHDGQWQPHDLYRQLIQKCSGMQLDVSFITFNYDIALDYALQFSGAKLDYGFGGAAASPGGIELFKLHGSMNWVSCAKCGVMRAASFEALLRDAARSGSATGTPMPILSRLAKALGPHCPETTSDFSPAVVPPSWNKTQYHPQFKAVWSRAAKALSLAAKIVVIGYSLPESDSFFRDLLALGLAGSARLRSFTVIDPSKDVADRFEALLGPGIRGRFRPSYTNFQTLMIGNTLDEMIQS